MATVHRLSIRYAGRFALISAHLPQHSRLDIVQLYAVATSSAVQNLLLALVPRRSYSKSISINGRLQSLSITELVDCSNGKILTVT